MDSPPESPPCGWTSCIDDDANEEKSFSERVFEGLSMFSKPGELNDPIAPNKDTPGSPASGTLSSCSSKHSLPDELSLKSLILNKDSSGILDNPLSIRELVNRATEESSANFIEDRPRPVGVAHEKFNLGNDDNFVFQDSAFAAMSDDDFSVGQSWSSGSSQQQQPQGDSGDLLTPFPETSTFLNDEDDSGITWNLECSENKEGEQGIICAHSFILHQFSIGVFRSLAFVASLYWQRAQGLKSVIRDSSRPHASEPTTNIIRKWGQNGENWQNWRGPNEWWSSNWL
jgi:hypothetical protein